MFPKVSGARMREGSIGASASAEVGQRVMHIGHQDQLCETQLSKKLVCVP